MDDPPDSDDGEWENRDTNHAPSPFGRMEIAGYQKRTSHSYQQVPSGPAELPEVVIERLIQEVAGLRRQSAEAVSNSLKLSEQLAKAQAEVAQSRAEIRDLEEALEDEQIRRREAERLISEQAKRRSQTEENESTASPPSLVPVEVNGTASAPADPAQ